MIHDKRPIGLGVVLLLVLAATPALVRSQEPRPAERPAVLIVRLPADAKLEIEGALTKSVGPERRFLSPPITPGRDYQYQVRATWMENGREMAAEKRVIVRAGQEFTVDFTPKPQEAAAKVALAENRPAAATAAQDDKEKKKPALTVPYVPTPQKVVDKMLEMAQVKKEDVVYDLGCGDGRIIVTAAKKYGCKGFGVDLDPERVKDSLENIKKNGVEKLVAVREGDVLKTDVSEATVVCLYLLPQVNLKLRPILQQQLKPGSRIVSHDFDMGDWKPVQQIEVTDEDGLDHTLYLWIIEKK